MNVIAAVRESQAYKNVYFKFYMRRLFPVKKLPLNKRQQLYLLKKIDHGMEQIEIKWNGLFGGRKESTLDESQKFMQAKLREDLATLRTLMGRVESNDLYKEDISAIHEVAFKGNKALHSLYAWSRE